MCNVETNIEYFAFPNCCNLTSSQIEIIIKFLKNFVKEGLKFTQMALCEGFSNRKCEILWLLSCIQFFTTFPDIMFEESACQKSDCLLNHIFYNFLTKR